MNWILKIIINFFLIMLLLLALKHFFKTFVIRANGILTVTILLTALNWALGAVLKMLAFPINLITFYIFSFFISWVIGIVIMKVTDKITDALTIQKTSTLVLSGLFLALTNTAYSWVVKRLFS